MTYRLCEIPFYILYTKCKTTSLKSYLDFQNIPLKLSKLMLLTIQQIKCIISNRIGYLNFWSTEVIGMCNMSLETTWKMQDDEPKMMLLSWLCSMKSDELMLPIIQHIKCIISNRIGYLNFWSTEVIGMCNMSLETTWKMQDDEPKTMLLSWLCPMKSDELMLLGLGLGFGLGVRLSA